MSDKTVPMENPFDASGDFHALSPLPQGGQPVGDSYYDQAKGGAVSVIVAQRCPVKRDVGAVMTSLKSLSGFMAERWYYSWRVTNADGTKSEVSGPSIGLAADLAREWGNCSMTCRVVAESPTHFTLEGEFIDFQTGFTNRRPFRQRKGQNLGKKMDAARSEDLVFQIAASKCVRNIVVNSLKAISEECVTWAKDSIAKRIAAKPEEARGYLVEKIAALRIPQANVERVMGEKAEKWTVRKMALLYGLLNSIEDGHERAEDVFPDPQRAEEEEAAEQLDGKKAAAAGRKKAAETSAKAKPAATAPAKEKPPVETSAKEKAPESEPAAKETVDPGSDNVSAPAGSDEATENAPEASPEDAPAQDEAEDEAEDGAEDEAGDDSGNDGGDEAEAGDGTPEPAADEGASDGTDEGAGDGAGERQHGGAAAQDSGGEQPDDDKQPEKPGPPDPGAGSSSFFSDWD